jgi:NADH:ubiquinone oxidoreductase subunit 6 (subunit J)
MHTVSKRDSKASKRRVVKPVAVWIGIALFVVGFVLTIAAIPHGEQSRSNDASQYTEANQGRAAPSNELYLASGILVSLAGVILATVVPAISFVKRASKD